MAFVSLSVTFDLVLGRSDSSFPVKLCGTTGKQGGFRSKQRRVSGLQRYCEDANFLRRAFEVAKLLVHRPDLALELEDFLLGFQVAGRCKGADGFQVRFQTDQLAFCNSSLCVRNIAGAARIL